MIKNIDIMLDEQLFAADTGKVFQGMTISTSAEGWRIIIRGTDNDGVAVYCMSEGGDIVETIKELYRAITGKEGAYLWRFDRYRNA